MTRLAITLLVAAGLAAIAGCNQQPTLLQNPDPALRKSVADLRDDSQGRFPYRFDAPHAPEARIRGQVEYGFNRLDVVNFTGQDWANVEVWVNQQYVCHIPVMQDRELKRIDFTMLYNIYGQSFPLNNNKEMVRSVEVYKDGTFHDIKVASYDW